MSRFKYISFKQTHKPTWTTKVDDKVLVITLWDGQQIKDVIGLLWT